MGIVIVEHLAHGSLHLDWEGMHIYVDPYSDLYDYTKMKKADLILLTHAHTDHYDCKAIKDIATPNTEFVVSKGVGTCFKYDLAKMGLDVDNNAYNVDPSTNLENIFKSAHTLKNCSVKVLENGDKLTLKGIEITATPAYNIENKRDNGKPFHLKGEGNGYILNMGGYAVYRTDFNHDKICGAELLVTKQAEDVKVSSIKACPHIADTIKNPSVSIGKTEIVFDCELKSGDFIEFDGSSAKLVDSIGNETKIPFFGTLTAPEGNFDVTLRAQNSDEKYVHRAKLTLGFTGDEIK
jgi:hypothetical protein